MPLAHFVDETGPDAVAVAIRTSAGLVLHTGDIKLDQLPLDGRLTDLAGFSRLGDEGVDLFLVDSTNAEVPGFTISEGELARAMFPDGASPELPPAAPRESGLLVAELRSVELRDMSRQIIDLTRFLAAVTGGPSD